MTHSERIFSKPIDRLIYSDIETYFTEARSESDLIEFKSYDTGRNLDSNFSLVHRSFCAFLNSQGGLIIWGAPAGITVAGQPEKQFQGALKPLQEVYGKDRMVNKLGDKIVPLPNSFKLEILANPENNKSVIIIEIEKSEYAPHQYDNNYYMRMDGQTRFAPHHYVEALFKQIKFPQIEGYLKFVRAAVSRSNLIFFFDVYLFNFSPLLNEENVSYQITCSPGKFSDGNSQKRGKTEDVLSYGSPFSAQHSIVCLDTDLRENSGKMHFFLQFIGTNCPTKISEYKLVLSDMEELNVAQLATKITFISENKLMSDREPQSITKNEKLQSILGRPYG